MLLVWLGLAIADDGPDARLVGNCETPHEHRHGMAFRPVRRGKLLERCKQNASTAACVPSGTPGNAVIQRTAA